MNQRITFIVNQHYPLDPNCTCRIEINTIGYLREIMRLRILTRLKELYHAGY